MRWCWALFCASFAIFCGRVARTENRPLAGTWSAGTLTERYNIGDWGSACGPRPEARDAPGGQVTIREDGEELVISGADRAFRTSECWEQLPGVSRTSHKATTRSWQTGCASAQNDPRQTKLVTTVRATDTTISLDEVAEYQFRIEGQNCTASARRSRNWTLVRRQGDAVASASASAPLTAVSSAPSATASIGATGTPIEPLPKAVAPSRAQPPPEPAQTPARTAPNHCASPGPPAQIDVRPARKVMRPGERFAFRTAAFDGNGCAVDPRAIWVVEQPSPGVTLAPGGTVVVADDAADGTAAFSVTSGGRAARVEVEVASPARYDSLFTTGDAAAADEPAATFTTGTSFGASSATAQDTAHTRKTIFIALIGVLALGLAALGLVLIRRAPVTEGDELARAAAVAAGAAAEPPNARGIMMRPRSVAPKLGMVCPSCRSEFVAGSMFCPHDGNRL
ncbi:MAG TPA: hypothetical protein VGL13_04280, partial [Polyangiaceae bacterium]